jgi:glycosidase
MFSLPGTPVLFYGEEIGMGENLSIPGRLSVRTPMQWSPAENGGFSDAPADALVAPLVEGDYGPAAVNVADQRRDPESLLNFFERLMRLRKQCPEIGFGRGQVLDAGDPAVFASRCDWRGGTVVAVHNLGAQACRAEVDLGDGPEPGAGDAEVSPLLGEGECRRDGDRLSVELPGYGSRWMRLGEPRRRPY